MQLTFAKRICECPVCQSGSVRRSARKGFVERVWLRFAFVWPYRCDDCDSRFWGFHRSYQAADSQFFTRLFALGRRVNAFTAIFLWLQARLKSLLLIRTAASVSDRPSSPS